jgi:hypothetical protein
VFQSDIVYTFFHPLLRDEQEAQKENLGVQKFRGILFYIQILVVSNVSWYIQTCIF